MISQFTAWTKQRAATLARRLGYIVIPAWHNPIVLPQSQEHTFHLIRYLRRLFRLLDVDCVLDVGANRGQYRNFLRNEVGYAGVIVSFEPIPEHVQFLKNQCDTNSYVEHCALGPAPGRALFNVTAETQLSSFLKPSEKEVTLFHDDSRIVERIEVEIKTIDEVIPELQEKLKVKNIYLKLDTQGFDLEVLRGARCTLNSVKALQFEASIRKIYDGAPRFEEVVKYCEERGFLMSGIYPNNAGFFPILIEFDCYLVHATVAPDWVQSYIRESARRA